MYMYLPEIEVLSKQYGVSTQSGLATTYMALFGFLMIFFFAENTVAKI